jgi:hypothetical protein
MKYLKLCAAVLSVALLSFPAAAQKLKVEDSRDEKGLTLPHGYRLVYSITGQNGTTEIEWSFKLSEFAFNQTLEEKTFDAEAN